MLRHGGAVGLILSSRTSNTDCLVCMALNASKYEMMMGLTMLCFVVHLLVLFNSAGTN